MIEFVIEALCCLFVYVLAVILLCLSYVITQMSRNQYATTIDNITDNSVAALVAIIAVVMLGALIRVLLRV